jgi:hypothetical protein
MKIKTYKKLVTMAKKIYGVIMTVICLIVLAIMVVPAFLLTLSTGTDGELTWMNFAGLAWLIALAIFWKMQSR